MLTDVAIVGAGPAGTAAAIALARAGRQVTVIDKATFPRDKFCGDGLTVGALRRLDLLGFEPARVPSWRRIDEVRVRAPRGRTVAYPLPPGPGAFAVVARRRELDAALVDLARDAGAEVLEGHALLDAGQSEDHVDLDVGGIGALRARQVIGADGMWSPLRRRLGLDTPGYRGEWHAFKQYVRHISPEAEAALFVSFERDLLPGYFWSFPVGEGEANIGFGILRSAMRTRDMKDLWPDLLARPHIARLLGPDVEFEGPHRAWPIPARVAGTVLSDGRVLFVGDAAAATDPLTGEGIGQALATGTWAAEAILAADPVAPFDAARAYETRVRRELVRDHAFAQGLSDVLASPWGAGFAIGASGLTGWTRRNFARWLFEDYPRAVAVTPSRWHRGMFRGPSAFR